MTEQQHYGTAGKQYAIVQGFGKHDQIQSYLPSNYELTSWAEGNGRCLALIEGTDEAGWTLDDYVIPRLNSGLWTVTPGSFASGYMAVGAARLMTGEGGTY